MNTLDKLKIELAKKAFREVTPNYALRAIAVITLDEKTGTLKIRKRLEHEMGHNYTFNT